MNLIEEHEAKKADIEADRVANLLLILQTLLLYVYVPCSNGALMLLDDSWCQKEQD